MDDHSLVLLTLRSGAGISGSEIAKQIGLESNVPLENSRGRSRSDKAFALDSTRAVKPEAPLLEHLSWLKDYCFGHEEELRRFVSIPGNDGYVLFMGQTDKDWIYFELPPDQLRWMIEVGLSITVKAELADIVEDPSSSN